jgi:peptidylprolyl isomerase
LEKNILNGVLCIMLLSIISITGYAAPSDLQDGLYAEIETTKGKIVANLEFEKTPITVANFTGLAEGKIKNSQKDGQPFYDGLKFHRVEKNFVIQGGCPKGDGTGNPGYRFPDEFDDSLKHSEAGILSMANSGPNSNGSQFFITLNKTPWLNWRHTVFGKVIIGMDVVNNITKGDVINSIKIIRVGKKAEAFKNDQKAFEELIKKSPEATKRKINERIGNQEKLAVQQYPKAKKTASGLRYIVVEEGTGDKSPKMGDKVTVHYSAKLLDDGRVVDSSYRRGKPLDVVIGNLIAGWNEALVTMKKGEKRTLIIPPDLGYGSNGAGNDIPPYAYLVFEVELINF